jgi:transglutaminase-like putative cysteine protease
MSSRRVISLLAAAGLALAPAAPGAQEAAASKAAARAVRPDALTLPRPREPEWFGLYLLGKKAGWTRMEVVRERRGGSDVLVARQETMVQASVGERNVERRQWDEKVYEARPGGRLVEYRSRRSGDGGDRTLELRCTPQVCQATFRAEGGIPQIRDLPYPGETAEQADPFRLAAALRGTVTGVQVEPEQLRVKKMKDSFLRRSRLRGAGVEVPVSIVSEMEEGDRIPAEVAVADDGRVVEIHFGEALVARAEPEEVAKRLDRVDLFGISRVPLPAPLPRAVPQRIQYRLRGLPAGFHDADGRQVYAPGAPGETVVTVTAREPAAARPGQDVPRGRVSEADRDLLRATPDVDSDNPEIARLAAEVVKGAPGVYAASSRLSHWVNRRLEKVYGQSRDRASEVLRVGKGDCTEHALLFVAMARAAGIPARGVHGLVFAAYADGVPALYWHAWAEVKAGNEWIAVDPTFDQPVADATHLALGRGTQVDSVALLGSLSVVAAEAKGAP